MQSTLEKHKNDSTDRRNKVDFKATMRSAFAKSTAIWNKVGRSVQTAEAVRNVAESALASQM
ncbi:unnamed protein product [Orchesella dallaii]|uniref:Uncharacterized protein n=1 Tax=Orchesella dallaii TaxID=48710 RepID=A0ABP1RUB9_9HEXA